MSRDYGKIGTPFIYVLFLLPVLFTTIMFISVSEDFGFLFPGTGEIEAFLGVIIFGFIGFWGANSIIYNIEKLQKPKIIDHIRQSSLFYILLMFGIYLAITLYPSSRGALGYGVGIVGVVISAWACIVNAVYLMMKRKS